MKVNLKCVYLLPLLHSGAVCTNTKWSSLFYSHQALQLKTTHPLPQTHTHTHTELLKWRPIDSFIYLCSSDTSAPACLLGPLEKVINVRQLLNIHDCLFTSVKQLLEIKTEDTRYID